MKTKLLWFGAFLMCLSVKSIAQTIKDAHVIGIIPLGSSEYSIIQEDNSDNYYKTSPHGAGELVTNQTVDLEFAIGETEQARVIASSLNSTLYCELVLQSSSANSTLPAFTAPTVENGILFFQSKQHIAEVYDALTGFTEEGDIDEQLDVFQAEYTGYVSFREHIITKYNWLNGSQSQQQLVNLYYEDFIADEIKKTFLNAERMVGVGDSVYYFHDLGEVYRCGKNNVSLIGLFEDADREDEPLDPASPTFQHLLEIDIMNGHSEGETRGTISVETESDDSCWYVTRLVYASDADCDPFKKGFSIHLIEYFQPAYGVRDSMVYAPGGISLEVDWKDGTSAQTFTSYYGGFIYHTYPDYGEFNPQTALTFTDRYGNEQTIEDGSDSDDGFAIDLVVDATCGKNDALEYNYANKDGFQIVGRVWINDNILGNHIGSFTHLYKWNGDGTLELVKGTLFTDVGGSFYDRYCDYKSSKYGDCLRKKQRKIQKVKTKLFRYYRYDATNGVKSTHWFVQDGSFSELNGHITPCD